MSVSILVVDDEPDVAELFRQRFRREAREGTYVMHYASSGEEALEQLSGGIEPPLVAILSDLNMPGMDGLEAASREAGDRRIVNQLAETAVGSLHLDVWGVVFFILGIIAGTASPEIAALIGAAACR